MRAFILGVVLLGTRLAGAQTVLTITAPHGRMTSFTAAALAAMPRDTVTAASHGTSARYGGPWLSTVLAAAKIAPIDSLRGGALRRAVVAKAADGYVVVFSAAELDKSLGSRRVLVADQVNGAALPAADGPVRLIVPTDGRPARWVRQLRFLHVVEVMP